MGGIRRSTSPENVFIIGIYSLAHKILTLVNKKIRKIFFGFKIRGQILIFTGCRFFPKNGHFVFKFSQQLCIINVIYLFCVKNRQKCICRT